MTSYGSKLLWLRCVLGALWVGTGMWLTVKLMAKVADLEAHGLNPEWSFLHFLPSLILFMAVVFVFISRRGHLVVLASSMVLSLALTMSIWIGLGLVEATQLRTNPGEYQGVRTKWLSASDLDEHFPGQIPPNAEAVRFFFRPRFLMGPMELYLRYRTNTEELVKLRKIAEQKRNPACDLKGIIAGVPDLNQFQKPFDQDFPPYQKYLPADFDLYYFDEDFPEMRQEEWVWNHGSHHGMAISAQRGEVLYWAEYW